MNAPELIRAELARAARELGAGDVEPVIERPRAPSLGDWASNIAMALARPLRKRPTEIAAALKERMHLEEAGVEAVEIAGPGFMNFRLDPRYVAESIREVPGRRVRSGARVVRNPCRRSRVRFDEDRAVSFEPEVRIVRICRREARHAPADVFRNAG